eukprot:3279140-Pleurochrysis_carterae.AAC.2
MRFAVSASSGKQPSTKCGQIVQRGWMCWEGRKVKRGRKLEWRRQFAATSVSPVEWLQGCMARQVAGCIQSDEKGPWDVVAGCVARQVFKAQSAYLVCAQSPTVAQSLAMTSRRGH